MSECYSFEILSTQRSNDAKRTPIFEYEEKLSINYENVQFRIDYAKFRAQVSGNIKDDATAIAEIFQELSEGIAGESITRDRDFDGHARGLFQFPSRIEKLRNCGPEDQDGADDEIPSLRLWKKHMFEGSSVILSADWVRILNRVLLREHEEQVPLESRSNQTPNNRSSEVDKWLAVLSAPDLAAGEVSDDQKRWDYEIGLLKAFGEYGLLAEDDVRRDVAAVIRYGEFTAYAQNASRDAMLGLAGLCRGALDSSLERPDEIREEFAKISAVFFRLAEVADTALSREDIPSVEEFEKMESQERNQIANDLALRRENGADSLLRALFKQLSLEPMPPIVIILPQNQLSLGITRTSVDGVASASTDWSVLFERIMEN